MFLPKDLAKFYSLYYVLKSRQNESRKKVLRGFHTRRDFRFTLDDFWATS